MEEWRDIKGYEGLYQVSNTGKVKSLNYSKTGKEGILKSCKNSAGYLILELFKNGIGKCHAIHRLVAEAFIPNIDNLPCINHKDENKENNYVENLEWITYKENANHGTRNERMAEKLKKPIFSISKESGLITYWASISEASKQTGINLSSISACCRGKRKSAGGFYWHYSDSEEVM